MTPEIDDLLNKRLESFIQTQNALFKDFTEKHVQAIDEKMDKKFNGKIDAFRKENQDMYSSLKTSIDTVDMKINTLKTETAPLVEGKNTFSSIFKFTKWATPLAIIYGALKWAKLI